MKTKSIIWLAGFLGCCCAFAQTGEPLTRVPNTTLNVPLSPQVFGYTTTNAFGNLTFLDPLAMATPPGETNRLFVVEQAGRIVVITNLAAPNRTLFLDISSRVSGGAPNDERGLLGLAFHPGYATNRTFYVFYTGPATTVGGVNQLHDILAAFQTSETNPNVAEPNSERRLIIQRDEAGNHNGGDIHFGPDGYLYVALGDEGGSNDNYNNSQTITKDLFAGIIRIDVDHRPGNLPPNPHPAATTNYAIPADNPFVGATSFNGQAINPDLVRTEFWAVGLRNPWRFSFDRPSGLLYCGDVGQNAWEEINIITKGGNYGWAYREGLAPGPKAPPPGFTSINPLLRYGRGSGQFQGFSVTGGVVYRGDRFAQLQGVYVFADYVSGNIWGLRHEGTNVTSWERLAGLGGIAGFGIDPSNGDVLMANQNVDTIRRLVYSSQVTGAPLPPQLSDTGAFGDLISLQPNAGIVPYDVNVPFWSDGAEKVRWFSIPDTNLTIGFSPKQNWTFPTGTVWIKQFEIELTNGVPESKRRLETRFLVRNTAGVHGFTYRWDEHQTNAALVAEQGLDEPLVVNDGGVIRTQIWHYPSRQECNMCHTAAGGFAAGFNTEQLNRDFNYGGAVTNQLLALSRAGYLDTNLAGVYTLPKLAHATNTAASLEFRVRSYLAANCAQCHQPGGAPQSLWDGRFSTPTPEAGIVNGPVVDDLGNPEMRVVTPGSPEDSSILVRINTLGVHRMPPLASSVLDIQAIELVTAWITNSLPDWQTFAEWQNLEFGSETDPDAAPELDPDVDGVGNYFEYLTGTDPSDPLSAWRAEIAVTENSVRLMYPHVANRGFEVWSTTNLFQPQWEPLQNPASEFFFPAVSQEKELIDTNDAGVSRFYKFRVFRP